MSLASAIHGSRRPVQIVTWVRDEVGTPEDLTGATLQGLIKHERSGETRPVVGTLTVVDGPAGRFTWDYADEDVATLGMHQIQFTATFAIGATPAKTFITSWEVKPVLEVTT